MTARTKREPPLPDNVYPIVRNSYSPRVPVVIDFTDAISLTKQAFKDECDINKIMRQYTRTGVIEHGNASTPNYGDAPAIDFQEAMNAVLQAEQTFDQLPSEVRREFNNNPAEMIDFCANPENLDRARALGLAKPAEIVPDSPLELPPEPSPPAED